MSDEVQQSKLLAVFDFDHTLVDGNTDTWVTKLLPSTMQLIREHHEKGWCWTNVMDKVFGVLHAENLTKEDYEKCFETLQFTEGMKEACNFLQTRKMSPVIFLLLVLLAVFLSGVDGINGTVSPGVGNSSSVDVNLSTTAVPTTQITTDLPTNATTQNATPGIKIGECHGFEVFILNSQLNIPYTVTCCIAVLCGFYLILFGYRFFKSSLFLLGFLFATFVTYIIGSNHADLPSWGLVAVAVAVGVFCGLLTMFVTYCGLFLGGFGLGFFIGIAIFFIVETFYHVSIKWIPFGVLLGLSLIFSLLTLRWQKGFFIVATSIIGAALITVGVDYFIEEFVLINYAWQRIMAGDEKVDCWVSWVLLAVWPVMFILGNVVQFCKTGRSYTHRKRSDSVSLQGEDKAMKRYRSLNMNGDVVAKSYYTKDEDERRPTEV